MGTRELMIRTQENFQKALRWLCMSLLLVEDVYSSWKRKVLGRMKIKGGMLASEPELFHWRCPIHLACLTTCTQEEFSAMSNLSLFLVTVASTPRRQFMHPQTAYKH